MLMTRMFRPVMAWAEPLCSFFRRTTGGHIVFPSSVAPIIDTKEWGVFQFKHDILDQLGSYFKYLRKMRRHDPEAYDLYSQVGAHLTPYDAALFDKSGTLSAYWRAGSRPSFGALFISPHEKKEDEHLATARFVYFRKVRKPEYVQMTTGDVYEITLFYHDAPQARCMSFHVSVGTDAEIKVLKELQFSRRHGIPRREWAYPDSIILFASESKKDVQDVGALVFGLATSGFEHSQLNGVRIRVSKGSVNAVFYVDTKRTAYFFRDRDATVTTASGQKKRIFHIVKPHSRTRAGQTKFIKTHFRGERDFQWNGYGVHITVPGLHHKSLLEFEGRAHTDNVPVGGISTAKMARIVDERIAAV